MTTLNPAHDQHNSAEDNYPSGLLAFVFSGGKTIPVLPWDGTDVTAESLIALQPLSVFDKPDRGANILKCLAAFDGETVHLILLPDVIRFLKQHLNLTWVLHVADREFHAIQRFIIEQGDQDDWLWRHLDQHRIYSHIALQELYELVFGKPDEYWRAMQEIYNNPLKDHLIDVPHKIRGKTDPRFSPFISKRNTYTVQRVIETYIRFDQLWSKLNDTAQRYKSKMMPEAQVMFGLATLGLQTKAGVAYERVRINGIGFDGQQRLNAMDCIQDQADQAIRILVEHSAELITEEMAHRGCLEHGYRFDQNKLQQYLHEVVEKYKYFHFKSVKENRRGNLPKRAEEWSDYRPHEEVLDAYLRIQELTKLYKLMKSPREVTVKQEQSYDLENGRVMMQLYPFNLYPSGYGMRESLVPRKGNVFLEMRYDRMDTVALAALCCDRWGRSRLAEVISEGADPYIHTAAMLFGLPYEIFIGMKDSSPEWFNGRCNQVRVIISGIHDGLDVDKIQNKALREYQMDISKVELLSLIHRITLEIYPELDLMHREDLMCVLGSKLGCEPSKIWAMLTDDPIRDNWWPETIYRVIKDQKRKNGSEYKDDFRIKVWKTLETLCRNNEVLKLIQERRLGESSVNALFGNIRVEPTGRLTLLGADGDSKDHSCRRLVSDGLKLALYRLVKEGIHVSMLYDDGFLIEVPRQSDIQGQLNQITACMRDEMQKVTKGLPVTLRPARQLERWQ